MDARILDTIVELRFSKNREAKRKAVRELGGFGTNEACDALMESAKQDKDPHVRSAAVEALGRFRRSEKIETFLVSRSTKDENSFVRQAAARGFGRMAGERALLAYANRFDSAEDVGAREVAIYNIGAVGGSRGAGLLMTIITQDGSPATIKEAALRAIRSCGRANVSQEMRRQIEVLSKFHPSPQVKAAAGNLVRWIRGDDGKASTVPLSQGRRHDRPVVYDSL